MKNIFRIITVIAVFNSLIYCDWVKINSHPNSLIRDVLISGGNIYTASTSGIRVSADNTASWQLMNNGLNNAQAVQCSKIIIAGGNLYAATVDGIYKSTNLGADWVKKSSGIIVGGGALYAFAEAIYEHNNVLYAGSYTGIYRSTDFAESWQATNINGSQISVNDFIFYNNILFAARESINPPGSYRSTDNGLTWSPFSISSSYLPVISFYCDGANLWAGTIDGAWLSTNSGSNWVKRSSGLSSDPYNSSILRVNGVLVTSLKFGGSGMFRSLNDGILWDDFKQGLPFLIEINKVVQLNSKILTGTSGGLYERNVSELTGIEQVETGIPAEYSLEQNYPNPFNPVTNIRVHISKLGSVKITLFNLLGELQATVLDKELSPGVYEVSFDARGLASGVYFYKLETNGFSSVKRMMIVK